MRLFEQINLYYFCPTIFLKKIKFQLGVKRTLTKRSCKGTLPCCAHGAQTTPPPLFLIFRFFSNSSPYVGPNLTSFLTLRDYLNLYLTYYKHKIKIKIRRGGYLCSMSSIRDSAKIPYGIISPNSFPLLFPFTFQNDSNLNLLHDSSVFVAKGQHTFNIQMGKAYSLLFFLFPLENPCARHEFPFKKDEC